MWFFIFKLRKEGDSMEHKDDVLADDRKPIKKLMTREYGFNSFYGQQMGRVLPER